REDERRRLDSLAAQCPYDGEAIDLRQHPVDDQHVVLALERLRQAFLSIGRKIGDMADFAKCLDKVIGSIAIVFDDQKAHDEPVIPVSILPLPGMMLRRYDHDDSSNVGPFKPWHAFQSARDLHEMTRDLREIRWGTAVEPTSPDQLRPGG